MRRRSGIPAAIPTALNRAQCTMNNAASLCPTGLICILAATTANATTWALEGLVDHCNPAACDLLGITLGGPVTGYIDAHDAASGPASTFTETDITDYRYEAQDVIVSRANGTLVSATLTTDANGELSFGNIGYALEIYARILGNIELDITIDVGASSWRIETDYLGFGLVASGPGQWTLQLEDTDGDRWPTGQDNGTMTANPVQQDTDGDSIGNACDADLNQDSTVNFADLGIIKSVFFTNDPHADFDSDGSVDFEDLGVMKAGIFMPPGPSGIANVCD